MRKSDDPTAYMREYMRGRRKAMKEMGRCIVCGCETDGKTLCDKHMRKQMAANKRQQYKDEYECEGQLSFDFLN